MPNSTAAAGVVPSRDAPTRDGSIDVVRACVMLLMVIDHVRDFCTSPGYSPTDPDRTTVFLFFTRWLTHFCTPVFVLLAGVGSGLSRGAGRSPASLARYLALRGVWLLLIELTWVRFGWTFDLSYRFSPAQVIWALGWSMIVLAVLLWLPGWLVAAFGLLSCVGHNALDGVSPERFASFAWFWKVVHAGGAIDLGSGHVLRIAYPLVPWIGVMALGYALGLVWQRLGRSGLCALGGTSVALFVVLRWWGRYGDPHPFVPRTGFRTFLGFLDCEKYPPSLDYLLMTIGPALLLLGLLHGRSLERLRALVVFGRVPLFFYLLHLPLVHALALPWRAARGLSLVSGPFRHGLDLSLGTVYALSALAIALLWWPCKRWGDLKIARPGGLLSYL